MITLLFLILLLDVVVFVVPKTRNILMQKPKIGILLFIGVIALLFIKGIKIQDYPLLLLNFLGLISYLFLAYKDNYKNFKLSGGLYKQLGAVLLLIALLGNMLFYTRDFVRYEGDYFVGTKYVKITNYNRLNSIVSGGFRNINSRVFYPSTTKGIHRKNLIDDVSGFNETIKQNYGVVGSFVFKDVENIKTNSYIDGKIIDDKKLPLVVISHDYMDYAEYYYDLAESLASKGYFVAVINHTGYSMYSTNDQSNIVLGNSNLLRSRETNPNYLKKADEISNIFSQDIIQTIDGLKKLSEGESSEFKNIDFDRIGLIGSALGGKAVLDSQNVEGVKGVIVFDPWVEPNPSSYLKGNLDSPGLYLISDEWFNSTNTRYLVQILEAGVTDDKYVFKIDGFKHKDFTLLRLFSPIFSINGTTHASVKKSFELKSELSDKFFDFYLKSNNTRNYLNEYLDGYGGMEKIMLR